MNASFENFLMRHGTYAIHYLVSLNDKNKNIQMHFVNSKADVLYGDKVYKAGTFSYAPNNAENGYDGGGVLEITVKDNLAIDLIENYSEVELTATEVMVKNDSLTKISEFRHHYGTAAGDKKKIRFTFASDDRQKMTFPALVFSNLNNKGNA